jgi:DNA-binding MarR family transcriptional regulator
MKQPRARFVSRNPLVEFWFRVQEFLRTRRAFAKSEGLDAREYELLLMLKAFGGRKLVNVSLIAESLFVHHHVAAGMVKDLAERGLIAAQRNQRDRRSLSLRLTRQGESLLQRVVERSVEHLASEGPGIISSLGKILGQAHRNLASAR